MSAFVPGRLVPILGRDAWALDESRLAQLLDLPESDELDFKREPCGTGDSDKRDFAADVAAFANHAGGLIVIGIAEATPEAPASLAPLPAGALDAEELRIRKIIASNCNPPIELQVVPVSVDAGGVLVVAIPPSPRSPHAVVVNEALRYPVRDGSTKRYLSESEVADHYRSRFEIAQGQISRLLERHRSLVEQLPRSDRTWLTVALQPSRPGTVEYTRELAADLRAFVEHKVYGFPSWHGHASFYVRGGFRSYRFRDLDNDVHSRIGSLFLDGGGTVAHAWDYRGDGPEASTGPYRISDEDLVAALINSLELLTSWAVDYAGVDGDAALVAQVHVPADGAILWQYRNMFRQMLSGSTSLTSDSPLVDFTIDVGAARADGTDLLLAVRSISEDLMSGFEFIEPMQIDRDGRLRTRSFYRDRIPAIESWAAGRQVQTTDEAVG